MGHAVSRSKITRSTYCAALENTQSALFVPLEKSHGQPTAPRSKKHTVSLMRARLRRLLCVPVPASAEPCTYPLAPVLTCSADPLRFPACTGPHAFPLAPDRFSFRYDLFFPFVIRSIELISVEAVFSAVGYDH